MGGRKTDWSILRHLLMAVALALTALPLQATPVAALSISDYFTFSYNVSLSQSQVYGDEYFYATITVQATCIKDLPLSPSEAFVRARVVAEHTASSQTFILNSSYTVTLTTFPKKAGETASDTRTVALRFPAGSPLGNYQLSGELLEARIKAVLWFTVTSYLPQYEPLGEVNHLAAIVPEPETPPPPPGTTDISDWVNWRSITIKAISATSADGFCSIWLEEGTAAGDKNGRPLKLITIVVATDPPATPWDNRAVSPVYEIGPSGALFNPPALLTLAYDDTKVPSAGEEGLFIAIWDEAEQQWFELADCIVNMDENTITVLISHFSTYAVMAHLDPGEISVSDLSVAPAETSAGQPVTITVLVAFNGDLPGSGQLILSIDDEVAETRQIDMAPGESQVVTFTVTGETAGPYSVGLNGLTGSFTVAEEPQPAAALLPKPPQWTVNWWLMGGIIALDLALLAIAGRLIWRPRASIVKTELRWRPKDPPTLR